MSGQPQWIVIGNAHGDRFGSVQMERRGARAEIMEEIRTFGITEEKDEGLYRWVPFHALERIDIYTKEGHEQMLEARRNADFPQVSSSHWNGA